MVLRQGIRFQPRSVSEFPLHCLNSCIPSPCCSHDRSPLGLPGFYSVSLPACHGLRTPADLHLLAFRRFRVAFRLVKTLGIRDYSFRELYQHFRVRVTPTAYRMLYLRLVHLVRQTSQSDSAMDPRLDTGGWLALARRGLSPRKIRRAYPGATTKQDQPHRTRGLGKATAIHGIGCKRMAGAWACPMPSRLGEATGATGQGETNRAGDRSPCTER